MLVVLIEVESLGRIMKRILFHTRRVSGKRLARKTRRLSSHVVIIITMLSGVI